MTGPDLQLAIDGGRPVREKMLPYGRQVIDSEDQEAVARVLQSDWLTTGPAVAEFEAAFAEAVSARHAVAVSNGTAALHAAAAVAGVGPGTEVIVPALTFAASANCARYLGADVVFADVRFDTLLVDSDAVAAAITPRTRAIVAVDYAGQPCDYDTLSAVAQRHGLTLIADAAHALGATYHARPVGSLASLTTFSLHPVKHITTGEGGVVTTDDEDLARALRRFRNHGITTDHRERERLGSWRYDMEVLGFNYRLTDFQCALGTSQLARLPAWLRRRRAIAARYLECFRGDPALEPPAVAEDCEHAWHLYVLRLVLDRLTVDRGDVFKALRAENIGVNVHYVPVYWHSYYQSLGYARGLCPVAEREYERMLSLPVWAGMTDGDVDDVVTALRKVVRAYGR